MKITHKVRMDMVSPCFPHIDMMQGDRFTREIEICPFSGGKPWKIPQHTSAIIHYQKPNKQYGIYDTLASGEPAATVQGNRILITVAPDVLSVAGNAELSVSLIHGQEELSTFSLQLTVHPNHSSDAAVDASGVSISGMLAAPDSAEVGQYLVVETVDENGKVLKLGTAATMSTPLVVSVSENMTIDHDIAEVVEAHKNGQNVWCSYEGRVFSLSGIEDLVILFSYVSENGAEVIEVDSAGNAVYTNTSFNEETDLSPLVVTIGENLTADRTVEEIRQVYMAGKPVWCVYNTTYMPLNRIDNDSICFGSMNGSLAESIIMASSGNITCTSVSLENASDDSGALPLSGGTMTGSINMNGNRITNVPTPTAAKHAANKEYVDSKLSSEEKVLLWENAATTAAAQNIALGDVSAYSEYIVEMQTSDGRPFSGRGIIGDTDTRYSGAYMYTNDTLAGINIELYLEIRAFRITTDGTFNIHTPTRLLYNKSGGYSADSVATDVAVPLRVYGVKGA